MIFLDELKNLKIYNKQFMFINEKDKMKNAAIVLLTPDVKSSIACIESDLINTKYYKGYYLEKDISLILNPDKSLVTEEYIEEAEKFRLRNPKAIHRSIAIRTRRGINKNKNNKKDLEIISDPKEENPEPDTIEKNRKEDDKEKLHIPTLNIKVPEPSSTPNSTTSNSTNNESVEVISNYCNLLEGAYDDYIRCGNNVIILNEDGSYDDIIKKNLYRERLKSTKEIIEKYKEVKDNCPSIKYTYTVISKYKERNIFVDLSYYNKIYFANSLYKNKKGYNIYNELMSKLISSTKLPGYDHKIILVPILDWCKDFKSRSWNYMDEISPISIIYESIRSNISEFKSKYKGETFVFLGKNNYFKLEVDKLESSHLQIYKKLINTIKNNEPVQYDALPEDSPKAIVDKVINNIESQKNITIHNLTGSDSSTNQKEIDDKIKNSTTSKDKDELVDTLKNAVKDNNSKSKEELVDDLSSDDAIKIAQLIDNIEQGETKISKKKEARIKALDDSLKTKSIKGSTVKDLLAYNNDAIVAPPADINIDSINKEEWKNVKFHNFNNNYSIDSDIMGMLYSLKDMSYPIYIRDINVEDTSTSEDRVETYTVNMEDLNGKRFTIKFDIPIVEDGYMVLRGNRKTISNQLFLKPLIETDEDVVQIVSNYNKIFIKRYGKVTGKSIVHADKIIKTLNNNEFKGVKIIRGDNTRICSKYALPIDYIDISSTISTIETKNFIIYFNQDEIREKYKDKINENEGIPYGYNKKDKSILYYTGYYVFSLNLMGLLGSDIEGFTEYYSSIKPSSRYAYSKASILNTDIPVIVICAYSEGLETTLKKADIKYTIEEKRRKLQPNEDIIKFKDGYLYYNITYSSSLLLNGLKECPTDLYSITEINNKSTYVDFLDNYGGRIKADGLDNFYDLMIDKPITEDVLKHYGYPTDYIELLIYSNNLLADNKFNRHIDMDGKRLRRDEIVAGYFYKALSESYKAYALELKHGRNDVAMNMKQSSVIDKIMLDPTQQDTSLTSVLLDAEYNNAVSTKGLSGMNSDRSYSLDKRTYDETMQNVIAMATGFAGNVGVTRQLTIDANVNTTRGYIDIDTNPDNISTTKTYCYTEALTPFGVTHDDPFRSAMTFIQTSKHNVRVDGASPMLITNGADEALPYLTSNVFSYKAKDNGVIKEITEDYMIVEYANGENDYINLADTIEKNSSSGSYITIKLDTDLKVGKKFKSGDILAYDKLSFNSSVGPTDNLAFTGTVLCKIALMQTDEGYEDSAIVSDSLCEKLTTEIVFKKEVYVPADTNVYNIVKPGTHIQEGENLMIMQTPYDEEEANRLLKLLADDDEVISDLGRIPIKSKITGEVQDIKIYRTVELDQLSDSLKKICIANDKKINEKKKVMKKYGVNKEYSLDPTYKLDPTGKLKGCPEGVLIEFYLKEHVKFGIGDKIVYYSANKGVTKTKFPNGKEPHSEFRPEEEVSSLVSVGSQQARMVTSIVKVGGIYKALIELDRANKEELGIPIDYKL